MLKKKSYILAFAMAQKLTSIEKFLLILYYIQKNPENIQNSAGLLWLRVWQLQQVLQDIHSRFTFLCQTHGGRPTYKCSFCPACLTNMNMQSDGNTHPSRKCLSCKNESNQNNVLAVGTYAL